MRDESRLNDLAAAEIAALERDGIKPTAAEIVLLNSLAWSVEVPESRRSLSRGIPVPVGRINLWPLTLYASDWLERVGSKMGEKLSTFAIAYAMANGYSTDGSLDCESAEAERRVKKWAKGLRCTVAELIEAVEQVLNQDVGPELPRNEDGKTMSVGDFSAFLAATCGADPEFWERRCAQTYAFSVLATVIKQNAADGKPAANDPRITAERALGYASLKIRERAKAEANG